MTTQTYPPFTVIPVDSSGNPVNTQTPLLGQQLAAGSMPVVLTVAQLAALVQPLFDSTGTRLPDDFQSLPFVSVKDSNGRISTITKTGVSGVYVQTFTYPDSVTTNTSAWVKQ